MGSADSTPATDECGFERMASTTNEEKTPLDCRWRTQIERKKRFLDQNPYLMSVPDVVNRLAPILEQKWKEDESYSNVNENMLEQFIPDLFHAIRCLCLSNMRSYSSYSPLEISRLKALMQTSGTIEYVLQMTYLQTGTYDSIKTISRALFISLAHSGRIKPYQSLDCKDYNQSLEDSTITTLLNLYLLIFVCTINPAHGEAFGCKNTYSKSRQESTKFIAMLSKPPPFSLPSSQIRRYLSEFRGNPPDDSVVLAAEWFANSSGLLPLVSHFLLAPFEESKASSALFYGALELRVMSFFRSLLTKLKVEVDHRIQNITALQTKITGLASTMTLTFVSYLSKRYVQDDQECA